MRVTVDRFPRIAAFIVATAIALTGIQGAAPAWAAPVTTATPTISGTAQVGQTLTADPGTWTPGDTTFSYQWKRGSTNVGTDSATYVVAAADVGSTITVTVTGSATGYDAASDVSAATSTVINGVFGTQPTPTISGTAQVGQTLTATAGTWVTTPTTLSYQWKRGSTNVGTDTSTYVVGAADVASTITVTVTASKSGYDSVSKVSASTSSVINGTFTSTPTPTIAGTAQVGQALTATAGTWAPGGATLSYQWKSGGTNVGTDSSTYVVAASDIAATITVTVTATLSGYTSANQTSAATSAVIEGVFTTAPTPTISGTAKVGQTLTATAGSWLPTPTSVGYQWLRDGSTISGATISTFVLTTADLGHFITVTTTATRSGFARWRSGRSARSARSPALSR